MVSTSASGGMGPWSRSATRYAVIMVNRPALDVYEAMMTTAADGMRAAGGFGVPERWRFDRERTYTEQQWLDLLPTTGGLTRLPPDTLAEVLDAVGAAIDAIGGGFTTMFTTVAISARRD